MVRLEGDIELNKKVVQRIKDEVDDMIKLGSEGAGKVKSTLEEVKPQEPVQPVKPRKEEMYEVSAFPDVKLLGEQCEWVNSATSKADISMHRLHSELPFDNPDGGPWKQGWDVTYKPDQWTKDNRLKIVVVPHTHCDPGWIKTFDDYYQTQTKSILNNFVPKLEENKNYKFMFSEISYFSQWWSEIDPGLRERVKRLIASGQFEISTGGWVMTDEADAHYYAMLDQLIEGHQWLNSSLVLIFSNGEMIESVLIFSNGEMIEPVLIFSDGKMIESVLIFSNGEMIESVLIFSNVEMIEPVLIFSNVEMIESVLIFSNVEMIQSVLIFSNGEMIESVLIFSNVEMIESVLIFSNVEMIQSVLIFSNGEMIESVLIFSNVEMIETVLIFSNVEMIEPVLIFSNGEMIESVLIFSNVEMIEPVLIFSNGEMIESVLIFSNVEMIESVLIFSNVEMIQSVLIFSNGEMIESVLIFSNVEMIQSVLIFSNVEMIESVLIFSNGEMIESVLIFSNGEMIQSVLIFSNVEMIQSVLIFSNVEMIEPVLIFSNGEMIESVLIFSNGEMIESVLIFSNVEMIESVLIFSNVEMIETVLIFSNVEMIESVLIFSNVEMIESVLILLWGYVPQSGWAVDPFGYSSTMAYLLKRSQFKSMLIQRVHYSIKKYLARERNLEFMWRQQWDSTGGTDIFTHMMPFYSYDIPHTCGPEPAVCCQFDFRRLPGSPYRCPWNINPVAISPENVEQRTKVILDQWKKKATLYKTNVVLIPLGDDFRYIQSDEFDLQFGNYEKIFNYLNSHPELGAVAQFGTLSDYFNTLYAETQTSPGQKPSGISTLSGDFFSYADRDDHYWTGYFTSRPLHKSLDRVLEHNLRSAEIIFSLTQVQARKHAAANFPSRDFMQKLVDARRALGLFQHHDAITGTAKDFVMVDYAQRLLRALQNAKTIISECSTFLLAQTKTDYSYTDGNPLFNIDQLRLTHDSLPTRPVLELRSEPKPVLLYNSLGQTRTEVVQLWTSSPYVEVRDQSDTVIHSQVDPLWTEPGAFSANIFKVSFVADLPGLSIRKFTVRKIASGDDTKNHLVSITYLNADQQFDVKTEPFPINFIKNEEDFKLETKFLECSFSGTSGLLKSVKTLTNGEVYKSEIEFIQYGTTMAKEKSGAYIFLPDGEAKPLLTSKPLLIRIIKGPISSEVHVVTQYIQHIARLHNSPGTDGASVDISNIVDIRTTQNKEVGMRIHTNIENPDHVFYSDLNGFQMQKRKYYQKLTLQGNFYPMPTMAYLQDGVRRVSVLSAQSAGAANLIPDSMDVMLDRRLSQDDNRGLGQGVLDNHPTLSKFRLLFEKRSAAAQVVAPESSFPSLLGQLSSLALIHPVFVMPRNVQGKEYPLNKEMLLLTDSLPCEVHLLNLRVLQHGDDQKELQYVPKDSSLLLLRNFPHDCVFAAPHLSCLSTDGKIVLSKLFSNVEVKESVQTSLTMVTQLAVIDPSSTLPVSPMEIVAVQVHLT
ncbi:Alpha-mannosidase 2x [Bulinus truncatus]|nr:Alpha-mannosidase 2x [Bulinus truncatus]